MAKPPVELKQVIYRKLNAARCKGFTKKEESQIKSACKLKLKSIHSFLRKSEEYRDKANKVIKVIEDTYKCNLPSSYQWQYGKKFSLSSVKISKQIKNFNVQDEANFVYATLCMQQNNSYENTMKNLDLILQKAVKRLDI